ncbi:MAG: hypothetical protein ACYSTT_24615, partial [Planctomycetota bacterium]
VFSFSTPEGIAEMKVSLNDSMSVGENQPIIPCPGRTEPPLSGRPCKTSRIRSDHGQLSVLSDQRSRKRREATDSCRSLPRMAQNMGEML